jgi:hypothetical protein
MTGRGVAIIVLLVVDERRNRGVGILNSGQLDC